MVSRTHANNTHTYTQSARSACNNAMISTATNLSLVPTNAGRANIMTAIVKWYKSCPDSFKGDYPIGYFLRPMYCFAKDIKVNITLLEGVVLLSGVILQAYADARQPIKCVLISTLFDDSMHRVTTHTVTQLKQLLKQGVVPSNQTRLQLLFQNRAPFETISLVEVTNESGLWLDVETHSRSHASASAVSITTRETKSAEIVSMYVAMHRDFPPVQGPLTMEMMKLTIITHVRTHTHTHTHTHTLYACAQWGYAFTSVSAAVRTCPNHTRPHMPCSAVCRSCMLKALLPGTLGLSTPSLETGLAVTYSERSSYQRKRSSTPLL